MLTLPHNCRPHFDLSKWAFEKLAPTEQGVIGIKYREVWLLVGLRAGPDTRHLHPSLRGGARKRPAVCELLSDHPAINATAAALLTLATRT